RIVSRTAEISAISPVIHSTFSDSIGVRRTSARIDNPRAESTFRTCFPNLPLAPKTATVLIFIFKLINPSFPRTRESSCVKVCESTFLTLCFLDSRERGNDGSLHFHHF